MCVRIVAYKWTGENMKKLYEVQCSVDFWIEVEAENEVDAGEEAKETLISRGVYDLVVSSSPMSIESVKELNEWKHTIF